VSGAGVIDSDGEGGGIRCIYLRSWVIGENSRRTNGYVDY